MTSLLGEEVAVGLLAGPEEFQRVREATRSGYMARLWRELTGQIEATAKDDPSVYVGGVSVTDIAFAAAVTGRLDWANRAVNGALDYCHKPHWLHWEAGCMPLEGMHMTHHVCLVTDWLWPILHRDQREALLGGVIAKGIENLSPPLPGVRNEDDRGQLLMVRRMDKDDPYCLHPHHNSVNNWDLWFSGGIFMAAALAERAFLNPDPSWPKLEWGHYYDVGYPMEQARIDRWKGIAIERITTALANELGPEGDYAEGISYAGYGGQAIITALTALDRAAGLNLFTPELMKMPGWLRAQFIADIPFGAANFNDARLFTRTPVPLLAHLARRTQDPEIQALVMEALDHTGERADHLSLLGLDPALEAKATPLPAARLFTHTGTAVWRTAQDRSGVFFVMQCGTHGGAHQHHDRNSIFLAAYGEHLIVDTGDGRYASPPSNPNHVETLAHSSVLIDGRGQIGDNLNPVSGHILDYVDEESVSSVLAEAGECYEGVESVRRRVVFARPDLLVLTDRVEGECSTLTWLLQGFNSDGKAEWICGDRQAVLSRPLAKLHIFFLEPVAGFATGVGTLDGAQREMLRLEASVPGKSVSAVLIPARADESAPQCERNADGTLTISFRGKAYTVTAGEKSVIVNGREFAS
ncbi:MAG: heparinase II/III domain-containing protein [Armatimonadota bacterium]